MALETLKNVKQLDGFDVHQDNEIANGKWADVDPKFSICIHHGDNTIAFRLQKGPIKEVGVNGCQVDTLVVAFARIIHEFNKKFPCKQNENALMHSEGILMALERRKKDRETRGVEGTSKV